MSVHLQDSFGRKHNYLRLAVTDRCNLRCHYCMPECGIDFVTRKELLTYEEMLRIIDIFGELGVDKLRITGGEPFARKDFLSFFKSIQEQGSITNLHLTTNGTKTYDHIPDLVKAGLKSVNISLDTLNPLRFLSITKFDELEAVLQSIERFVDLNVKVKINMVVMQGVNVDEVIEMAQLAKNKPIEVRFLEEMPFNGSDEQKNKNTTFYDLEKILKTEYPDIQKQSFVPGETSQTYKVPGWKGNLGIIASYSRTFCGSCNRLRVTPTGELKTCLYTDQFLDLRGLLRDGTSDLEIQSAIVEAVMRKDKDGFIAEANRTKSNISESMATIGG